MGVQSASATTLEGRWPGGGKPSGPDWASSSYMSLGPSAATTVGPAQTRPEWGW